MRLRPWLACVLVLLLAACSAARASVTPAASPGESAPSQTLAADQASFETLVATTATALHLTAQAIPATPAPPVTRVSVTPRVAPVHPATATTLVTPVISPCAGRTDWPVYTVRAGDTLSALAAQTGASVETLIQTNCLPSSSLLAGQLLRLPRLPASAATPMACAEALCFTANPSPAAPGGTVTLSWNAAKASQVHISWSDKQAAPVDRTGLPPAGTLTVALSAVKVSGTSVTFSAESLDAAQNRLGFKKLDVPLQTNLAIRFFRASPAEVTAGEPVTLSWEAVADWANLTTLDAQGRLTNDVITVPVSGQHVMATAGRSNGIGYMLAAGSGDLSVTTYLDVKLKCTQTWFFPSPPAVCPFAPHTSAMAVEPFQHGQMLWVEQWLQGAPAIIVLYDQGLSGKGHWAVWDDLWTAGMPDSDPALTPPPGVYQPRRGFGKLWREQAGLRDSLGWATAPETALNPGIWQWDTLPKYNSGYITGLNGQVYVLGPEQSSWSVWAGAPPAP